MIEVELKYALPPGTGEQIEKLLVALPHVRRLHNIDTYFDTAAFDLLRQAVFVRIRNQQRLEFKFNEQAQPSHISCTEHAFSLMPPPQEAREMNVLFSRFLPKWYEADTVDAALRQNGLAELACIENHRVQYSAGDLLVCLDRVTGLGEFLEVEVLSEEGRDPSEAIERAELVVAGFAGWRVHVGYVELWLKRHHPEVYALGKYHEERLPAQASASGTGKESL